MTESILEEAQRLIHGPRNKNYGHPRDNFRDIAALWSGYLGKEVSDIDVANLMILMKVARVKGTGYHRDSFTDIAGYAGCVERIYEEPEEFQDVLISGQKWLLGSDGTAADGRPPRVWDQLKDIPPGVCTTDVYGNFWESLTSGIRMKYLSGSDGWYPVNSQYFEVYSDQAGPFTEVLEAE